MTHSRNELKQRLQAPAANSGVLSRWSIVLAGGEGERLRPLIESKFGHHRPKQYCALAGSRTMLEHTYDRAAAIVPRGQRLTIIGPGHDVYLNRSHEYASDRQAVIEQPYNRGTAPGILIPLCVVLANDPSATVLILPSDHFIYPEDRFVEQAKFALQVAEQFPHHIVLMGAEPHGPETDYGWVDTTNTHIEFGIDADILRVKRFCEKPAVDEAARLYACGAIWNTMIMAVKAKTLWELGRQCLPDLAQDLSHLVTLLRAKRVGRFRSVDPMQLISEILGSLQPLDFSAEVLQHVSSQILASPLRGVYWNDWGRPERVAESLDRIRISGQLWREETSHDPLSVYGA